MASLLDPVTFVVLMGMLDRVHFIGQEALTSRSSGWMFNIWLLLVILIPVPAFLIGVTHLSVDFLTDRVVGGRK